MLRFTALLYRVLDRRHQLLLRSPAALLGGLMARKRMTIRFVSGLSVRDLLVTCGMLLILLMSAIGVVYSSHLCRQLFSEQAVLLERNDQLQLEWAQLLLEESAWSSPNRIESIAREDLEMVLPVSENIELVK